MGDNDMAHHEGLHTTRHQHAHAHANHHHHHHHDRTSQGDIRLAFLLNASFSVIELVGGFMTNSAAIMSDAVHDFGDALVLGSSWLFERKAEGGADETHTFGYRRYSTVGAFITTVVLLVGSVGIVVGAVPRIFSPVPVDDGGMMALAAFGIAMNGLAAWQTSGGDSLNRRAVNLHMMEDVLGWVAVLVGAVAMRATGWYAIDPILSVAIAVSIARGAVLNLMDIVPVFLDAVPSGISLDSLADVAVDEVFGVTDVHHVHVWSLDAQTTLATAHVVWDPDLVSMADAKAGVRYVLAVHGIGHATLEMEPLGERCSDECAL